MLNNHVESNDLSSEVVIDLEQGSNDSIVDKEFKEEVEKDIHPVNEESNAVEETLIESSIVPASVPSPSETIPSKTALDEESKTAFRAPLDDTQDLSDDSQQSEGENLEDSQEDTPVSSEEGNDDKDNIDTHPCKLVDGDLLRKHDPVKAFVDDEAEEEDDSDNDLMQFKENENDDENEESEEFNDLIVSGYKENQSDNAKRDQLHQMWLEQQDTAATDNVWQRLKSGGKQHREPTVFEEVEDDEDASSGEDSVYDEADHLLPTKVARINTEKNEANDSPINSDKESSKTLNVEELVDLVSTVPESESLNVERDLDTELDDLFTYQDRLEEDQTVLNVDKEDLGQISKSAEDEIEGKKGEETERFADEKMG